MRIGIGLATAIGLTALSSLHVPALADGRDNPFTPPPSPAEEQARLDERMKRTVREMFPDIETRVMQRVSAFQAASEIKLRTMIEERAGSGASAAAGTSPSKERPPGRPGNPRTSSGGDTSGTPAIPEGATFLACINGKALYRAQDKSTFQMSVAGPEGVDRCAR